MEGGGLHDPTKAQGMTSSGSACGRAKPQSARALAPIQKKDLAVHPLHIPILHTTHTPYSRIQGTRAGTAFTAGYKSPSYGSYSVHCGPQWQARRNRSMTSCLQPSMTSSQSLKARWASCQTRYKTCSAWRPGTSRLAAQQPPGGACSSMVTARAAVIPPLSPSQACFHTALMARARGAGGGG